MQLASAFAGGCNNNLDELASHPLRNCLRELQMARTTAQKMQVPTRATIGQVQVKTTVAMKKETFSMTTARGTGRDIVLNSVHK